MGMPYVWETVFFIMGCVVFWRVMLYLAGVPRQYALPMSEPLTETDMLLEEFHAAGIFTDEERQAREREARQRECYFTPIQRPGSIILIQRPGEIEWGELERVYVSNDVAARALGSVSESVSVTSEPGAQSERKSSNSNR